MEICFILSFLAARYLELFIELPIVIGRNVQITLTSFSIVTTRFVSDTFKLFQLSLHVFGPDDSDNNMS